MDVDKHVAQPGRLSCQNIACLGELPIMSNLGFHGVLTGGAPATADASQALPKRAKASLLS